MCWIFISKNFLDYRVVSFFISPVADNLTTALLMCAVVMAIGRDNAKFISLACINIVVAANAGGHFLRLETSRP